MRKRIKKWLILAAVAALLGFTAHLVFVLGVIVIPGHWRWAILVVIAGVATALAAKVGKAVSYLSLEPDPVLLPFLLIFLTGVGHSIAYAISVRMPGAFFASWHAWLNCGEGAISLLLLIISTVLTITFALFSKGKKQEAFP